MGFREPLDVSEYVKQYEAFGGKPQQGPPQIDAGKAWYHQAPGAFEREQEQIRRQQYIDDNPQIQGYGPVLASSCRALVPSPQWCWDVNGYYRTLGVHWKATRKELMVAFQAFGTMPDAYTTYVFKQLLNQDIRRAYDIAPLGRPFLDDVYVQKALKNKAAQEAARRSQDGRPTTAKEVIEEEYKFVPEDDQEGIDGATSDGADSDQSIPTPWPFAYYTWRSKKAETDVLAEWQSLVLGALAEQGAVRQVAVGFLGKQPHRYLVGRIGKIQVAFISDKECPTPALASAAALALINDSH